MFITTSVYKNGFLSPNSFDKKLEVYSSSSFDKKDSTKKCISQAHKKHKYKKTLNEKEHSVMIRLQHKAT